MSTVFSALKNSSEGGCLFFWFVFFGQAKKMNEALGIEASYHVVRKTQKDELKAIVLSLLFSLRLFFSILRAIFFSLLRKKLTFAPS
ncbi:MAG: hypothetical protein ACI86C_001188 [Candidatus Latescibacterota bacterium]